MIDRETGLHGTNVAFRASLNRRHAIARPINSVAAYISYPASCSIIKLRPRTSHSRCEREPRGHASNFRARRKRGREEKRETRRALIARIRRRRGVREQPRNSPRSFNGLTIIDTQRFHADKRLPPVN